MIVIRPFSPTDVPAVMTVVKQSLGETYPPSLYLTVYNLWSDGFQLLLHDGRVVAFIAAVPTGTKVARILMLAVIPEFRRKTMGKKLMSRFYQICLERGLDSVILEVRKSNKEAIAFYEREGFSVYGEIPNFYSNGEGAFKMTKVLQS